MFERILQNSGVSNLMGCPRIIEKITITFTGETGIESLIVKKINIPAIIVALICAKVRLAAN